MIAPEIERRARWLLDTLGARELGFGDDVPYREEAWEQVARGERPVGDELADAFFHLARLEERGPAGRDVHRRFAGRASCLDPDDPPLERLRARLGVEPPRWWGARFAVALTHDVDIPWRWTPIGIRGAAARLKQHVRARQASDAGHEARALAAVAIHRLRGSDPNWRFGRIVELERARGAKSTFFVLVGHHHPADGAAPEEYERLLPRLVETLRESAAEIELHGSYTAADDPGRLSEEKRRLEALAGPLRGHRYHYLRVDPHVNLQPLEGLGFGYDSSLGFVDRPGFRAGIAQPFRPWDVEHDRPFDLIEIPLAAMDVTYSEARYLGLDANGARERLRPLLDWAEINGGGFAVLWHTDRFDPGTARGWDRLYEWLLDEVALRGGVCVSAGELAEAAAAWLR